MGETVRPVEEAEEIVKVPMYGGSYSDEPTYIWGKGREFSAFRECLVGAEILE